MRVCVQKFPEKGTQRQLKWHGADTFKFSCLKNPENHFRIFLPCLEILTEIYPWASKPSS